MLLVLKKDKIVSYLVTLGIIVMLFAVGNIMPNTIEEHQEYDTAPVVEPVFTEERHCR